MKCEEVKKLFIKLNEINRTRKVMRRERVLEVARVGREDIKEEMDELIRAVHGEEEEIKRETELAISLRLVTIHSNSFNRFEYTRNCYKILYSPVSSHGSLLSGFPPLHLSRSTNRSTSNRGKVEAEQTTQDGSGATAAHK